SDRFASLRETPLVTVHAQHACRSAAASWSAARKRRFGSGLRRPEARSKALLSQRTPRRCRATPLQPVNGYLPSDEVALTDRPKLALSRGALSSIVVGEEKSDARRASLAYRSGRPVGAARGAACV